CGESAANLSLGFAVPQGKYREILQFRKQSSDAAPRKGTDSPNTFSESFSHQIGISEYGSGNVSLFYRLCGCRQRVIGMKGRRWMFA
ncbi:MAG: hypothetical protein ACE5Q3_11535, partial [Alphaproteobacteria bacterium]